MSFVPPELRSVAGALRAWHRTWRESGAHRLAVLFEGRDASGKSTAIEHLVRVLGDGVRVVHLGPPTDAERSEPYFERYRRVLPRSGEVVFLDRSWYNRATVEPVMGFCTEEDTQRFLEEVAGFEQSLEAEGITLVKIYLAVSRQEQARRLSRRVVLSPIDAGAGERWSQYTQAEERLLRCDHPRPWVCVDTDSSSAFAGVAGILLSVDVFACHSPAGETGGPHVCSS